MKDILRRIAGLVVEIQDPSASTPHPGDPLAPPPLGPTQKKTIADIVKAAPGPNLDEVHVPVKAPQSSGAFPASASPPPGGANPVLASLGAAVAGGSAAPGEVPSPSADAAAAPAALPPVVPTTREDGSLVLEFTEIYRRANLPPTAFSAEQTLDMISGLPKDLPLDTKRQMVTVMLSTMGRTVGVTQETIVTDAALKLAALASYAEGMTKQAQDFIVRAESEITRLEAQMQQYRVHIDGMRGKMGDIQRLCAVEADRLDDVAEFFSLDTGPSKHAAAPASAEGNKGPA